MKKAMLPLLLILALVSASCSAVPDSQISSASIEERLAQLDAYRETIPDRPENSSSPLSALSFRGIAFGSTMSEVEAAETQALTQAYSNALDFEPVTVYSYSMQPTYWFNDFGQLFSGGYSMTHNEYAAAAQALQSSLTAEYGEPVEACYYDYNDTLVTYASDDEALAAIDSGSAYYYVSYTGTGGLFVELYVEASDSGGYAYYIYYSDPAYID